MKIKIDKGIPIPPIMGQNRNGVGRPAIYPFATMRVGESFFLPCKDTKHLIKVRSNLSSCWRRHRPKRFKTRTQQKPYGIRAWRVK